MSARLDTRVVDPTRCWLRHVRRTRAGELVGATIAGATFTAQPLDALGGRQGWQSADASAALSDNGELAIRFPNAAGEDGVLHRRRFAINNDPAYRPGEEWLELYREPYDVVAVITPTNYSIDRQTFTIKGYDVAGHLGRSRGSELDVWDAHAPRDVFEHYTRLEALALADEFGGFNPAAPAPWTFTAGVNGGTLSASPVNGVPRIASTGGSWSKISRPVAGVAADCWTVEARIRWVSLSVNPGYAMLNLQGAGSAATFGLYVQLESTGIASLQPGGVTATQLGKSQSVTVPGETSIRLIARYDRIYCLVNGELVVEVRRPKPFTAPTAVEVQAYTATIDVDAVHVEHLPPYALRGADKGDRLVPGLPPAVGLRARYYNIAHLLGISGTTYMTVVGCLWRVGDEPIYDRLEPVLGGAPGGLPPFGGAWAARWSGAVYLDLAASDRRLRLVPSTASYMRAYVGRTLRGVDEAIDIWPWTANTLPAPPYTTANLRALLGNVSGWYPIVVEMIRGDATAITMALHDAPVDAAGNATTAFAVVPTSRLSPIGTHEEQYRHESHREVLAGLTTSWGLQWRAEPRSLESGEFPGQVIPRVRVGRDTDAVIDDLEGTDLQVEGDAADTVDSLIADAAGIADPKGSGQLSAQVIDYPSALAHLGMSTDYESLSEISEAPMLETRLGSLLALRSSPNEQVGVRPRGQRDLADTFPLSGALALMRWLPGDGVRLELDDVDVIDRTPRQLTTVQQTHLPAGVAAPTVGFRQRPRSPAAVLKRMQRAILGLGRNYQGTLAIVSGAYVITSVAAGGATGYAYFALPPNLDDVVAAWVDIASLPAGLTISIEVMGVNAYGPISAPGRYDVTRFIRAESTRLNRAWARLTSASIATGVEFQLCLLVRV